MKWNMLWAGVVLAVGVAGTSSQASGVLQSTSVLDGSRFGVLGYINAYQASFVRDTSKGDPAGVIVDFSGQYSNFGQSWTTPQNWSTYNSLSMKLENLETFPIRIVIDLTTGTDTSGRERQLVVIPAGQTIHVVYDLDTSAMAAHGLKSLPPAFEPAPVRLGRTAEPNLGAVTKWEFYNRGTGRARMRVWDLKLVKVDPNPAGSIDAFGQTAFGTWVGKITNPGDFELQRQAEDIDLTLNPGPGELQGSNTLPRQTASSKWRTVKLGSGKWYLVHPSGKLFWSMGVTTVSSSNPTVIGGRTQLFQQLPNPAGASSHYGTIMQQGVAVQSVNFTSLNLENKYGSSWQSSFATQALRRLDSWGYNTVGDWSDTSVRTQSTMPIVVGVNTNDSAWRLPVPFSTRTLPDPFASNFQSWFTGRLAQAIQPYNGRPEYLGSFVDVELPWGRADTTRGRYAVALATLVAPNDQPAKKAFTATLRSKYTSISRLNRAWGTSFASWSNLSDPGETLRPTMIADCQQFVKSFASTYYKAIAASFVAANSSGLYLGSREGWQTTPEVRASANLYVDVFSTNIYQRAELVDWSFPEVTKPVLVGEFSFCATDRGMWHAGDPVATNSHADRAERMRDYYQSALTAPKVVGAHWFQYMDQPVTGRFDGENYNLGLVTATDTPHPEMREVSRIVGANLYLTRGN